MTGRPAARVRTSSPAAPGVVRRVVRLAGPSALLLVTIVAAAGCTTLSERLGDDGDGGDVVVDTTLAADVGLATVDWAVFDGVVSVLVRNDTARVLRRADAIARAQDSRDITLASSATTAEQGRCCSAVNVPPGGTYGFYFPVGERADQVDEVVVDYADVAWSDEVDGPSVVGEPVEITTDDTGAVAVADLVTTGGPVAEAIVQAQLRDAEGELLTVVSGRWACLTPDAPTQALMQLFRPVPAGTTLSAVEVFPLDAAGSDPASCG